MENQYEPIYDQKIYDLLYDMPEAIVYLKSRYQTDQVWKYCIEREPKVFAMMKNPSVDMCVYALDIDGSNIITIRTKFTDIKIDKRMAYIALRTYPAAILHIPSEILNEEMFDLAFNAQPSLISQFNNLPYTYLLRKIRENPSIIKHMTNLREDLACVALSMDPNLCVYIPNLTTQMINLLRDLKPELAELYTNTLESETENYAENCETRGAEEQGWSDSY